jgi:hypothetical protein
MCGEEVGTHAGPSVPRRMIELASLVESYRLLEARQSGYLFQYGFRRRSVLLPFEVERCIHSTAEISL